MAKRARKDRSLPARTRRSPRPGIEIENIFALYNLDEIPFFGYRLGIAAKLYDRCVSRIIDRHGLNLPQWRVMAQLSVRPGGTIRALAEGAAADRAESSRAVRDLMDRDIVTRHENPQDARSPSFTLTDAGRALYESIRPALSQLIEELTSGASAEDIAVNARILHLLTVNAIVRLDGD
jgi:DNA-binding MarR family transcriptional regulator